MPAGLDDAMQSSTAPGAHDVVLRALVALEASGVTFALLRSTPSAGTTGGDVDVLIQADDIATAERCLAGIGWLRVHSAGHGSHRFHMVYDAATRTWHQLDLVSRLDFGPMQAYRTQLAEACLSRHVRQGGMPVMHADDAFWLLLYSALLQIQLPAR